MADLDGSECDRRSGEEHPSTDGTWIRITPPGEAEGELADVYESIGALRTIAHILGVHSLHPSALRDHFRLYRTLMFGPSPLSRSERESVAVVVSAANDCFY